MTSSVARKASGVVSEAEVIWLSVFALVPAIATPMPAIAVSNRMKSVTPKARQALKSRPHE